LETYRIHINGIVQGVGFRPLVYQLAVANQLNGYVMNGNDGVHVFFNASETGAKLFLEEIKKQAPQRSIITASSLQKIEDKTFNRFEVLVDESNNAEKQVLISPDIATCSTCQHELLDETNRRYRYPFITCTQCGPRYSIINQLPYERHSTSMQGFTMCGECGREYAEVTDRRFFSQTNSCAACGVELGFWADRKTLLTNDSEAVLQQIKQTLQQGKIIAVKGIGGYLLLCEADVAETIQLLRNRKHRPQKPFALLYPDVASAQLDVIINEEEKALLQSEEAPVVLLRLKPRGSYTVAVEQVAPGLNRLGVMMPYSPLLHLIAGDYGKPLVATSANISGSPILYKDEDALDNLFGIADYVVSYNREIVVPQDDSVVQVSPLTGQKIMIRRSRGYAPGFLQYKTTLGECVLATGALLKSSFALAVNCNVFISQFLGSTQGYEAQQMYRQTLAHWLMLYSVKPAVIIADKHPGYFSHQYAGALAEEYGVEVKQVQHHEAHFAAVLAENDLIKAKEKVLGVVWDGTGLGNDGNIWGGEFFVYKNNAVQRYSHLAYFPVIAGDKMALEPRIAALCAANGCGAEEVLKKKFTETEWNNYRALVNNATLYSSSAGRLFDAVASLLGVCDKQTYEGEAAMHLQVLAEEYIAENGFVMQASYFNEDDVETVAPVALLLKGIVHDISMGMSRQKAAAKFHYSLVRLVDIMAKRTGIEKICFSGGVFQNALLADWLKIELAPVYKLYFHKNLSPNDECISFGQMVYYEHGITTANSLHVATEKGYRRQAMTAGAV
jgi:hydrogenase maturation protein HypF